MADPQRKSIPTLMPDSMGHSEDKEHRWVVDLPMDVQIEQTLDPSYWSHVAEQMQPLDEIKLRAADGSWIAFLHVSFCERNYARVVLDRKIDLKQEKDVPISSIKHKVEWKGPKMKWCVIRIADSKLLREGEENQPAAALWLTEHERTLGK